MSKIKVITDSCADLGKDIIDEYDLDYVKMSVLIGGERAFVSFDRGDCTPKALYSAMREGKPITLEDVSATEFTQVFTKYVEDGYDVVYISCSKAMSDSLAVGKTTARSVMEKHVGSKIICVDSKSACGGEALVAIEAAKLARTAQTAEEVVEHVERLVQTVVQVCTTDDLETLKKVGIINAPTAFFYKLSDTKPIVVCNEAGNNVAVKKSKGRRNAIEECITTLGACISDSEYPISEQTVFVEHADDLEAAEYIAEKVNEMLAPGSVRVGYLGPTLGAKLGAGAVAVFGFGDPSRVAAIRR